MEHLPGGGFLLQANELFEQYRHERAHRVFRGCWRRRFPPVFPRAAGLWQDDLDEFAASLDDVRAALEPPLRLWTTQQTPALRSNSCSNVQW